MKKTDEQLQEFFDEERRRDRALAPSFRELIDTRGEGPGRHSEPDEVDRPRWPFRGLAAAALILIGLGIWLVQERLASGPDFATNPTSSPDEVAARSGSDPDTALHQEGSLAELDGLCDAVLAALDEHDAEFNLRAATDDLFAPFDFGTD